MKDKSIKKMLLGIAIMLITIIIHLFYQDGLWTDFIAIIGFIIIVKEYYSNNKQE